MADLVIPFIEGKYHIRSGGFMPVQARLKLSTGAYFPSAAGKEVGTAEQDAWVLEIHPEANMALEYFKDGKWKVYPL